MKYKLCIKYSPGSIHCRYTGVTWRHRILFTLFLLFLYRVNGSDGDVIMIMIKLVTSL